MTEARLQDKQALVTGAGSGIGKATAIKFAAEGALVGVMDVDEDKVMETVKDIQRKGGEAVPLVGDISSSSDVENAVRTRRQGFRGRSRKSLSLQAG